MRIKLMFILILMVIGYCSYATHNRAGEITYEHVSGLTYRITITTYTKESSCAADRCELEINFGDNSKDTISRVNGTGNIGGICGTCDCQNCGELLGNDIKKNVYTVDHTYSGLGTYTISVEDPNRNDNINNIPNSVHVPFFISSELIIAPGLINESPTLTNPPIDNGCINFPYLHNPGAIDPDGDSLVYSIVPSLAGNGASIPNYVFPNQVSGCIGGTFSIDPVNGTLLWDSPNCQGEYNVAILIEEYRNGFKIGSVRRDMQITIKAPCPNQPPDILPLDPLCVFAGDTIQETVIATDPDIGDFLTLTATGEPLTLTNSPATFNTASAFDSVVSVFEWFTNCSHVRNNDYQTVFKVADDNSTVQLVDFETFVIKVIAPAPENLTAEPQGNSVILNWDPSFCPDISGYKIYRRIDSLGFSPDSCETGAPAGYNLIATINGNATMTYQDSDNLVHGQKYCYLIVACFPNGAVSQASFESCTELKKDVPIITHVTVNTTDQQFGEDSVIWSKPTELDTIQFSGPYRYRVLRQIGFNGANSEIYSSPPSNFLFDLDTVYKDVNLNTEDTAWNYKVELYYNSNDLVGSSNVASSVFLGSTASDNSLILSWQENVPWTNKEYVLFRETSPGNFTLLDTVVGSSYSDIGLINGEEYCYYVQSIGSYSTTGIINPILNRSQIHCNIPVDNVPPCPPDSLSISSNCENSETTVIWNNPITIGCADDVVRYNVYFTPILGGEYSLIETITNALDTFFFHDSISSIAGCYAITALDTFLNESVISDTICIDNCPIYELPNVFSPGSDGFNDLLRPFPYRHIQGIDIKIYNRWGDRVFKSTDPDILWDGNHEDTGVLVSDGVYYYVCDVLEIRLTGIEKRTIKGYFHVISESSGGSTE